MVISHIYYFQIFIIYQKLLYHMVIFYLNQIMIKHINYLLLYSMIYLKLLLVNLFLEIISQYFILYQLLYLVLIHIYLLFNYFDFINIFIIYLFHLISHKHVHNMLKYQVFLSYLIFKLNFYCSILFLFNIKNILLIEKNVLLMMNYLINLKIFNT
jgi:hypothetical protein